MRRTRRGFTLVELLVVLAVMAILVALLFPAVNAARSVAQRIQCQNNIKNLGLALLNYESAHHQLPPSSQWPFETRPGDRVRPQLGPNWVIVILPYIEEQALQDAFDLSQPINSPSNEIARGTIVPPMLCPADSYNRLFFNGAPVVEQIFLATIGGGATMAPMVPWTIWITKPPVTRNRTRGRTLWCAA